MNITTYSTQLSLPSIERLQERLGHYKDTPVQLISLDKLAYCLVATGAKFRFYVCLCHYEPLHVFIYRSIHF